MSPSNSASRARQSTQPTGFARLGNGLLTLALFMMIIATFGYLALRALTALDLI